VVLSDETHAADAERSLRRLVAASRHQAFRVELNARVARILIGSGAARLIRLEEETGRRFFLESRDDVPADHLHVLAKGPVSRLGAKSLPVSTGDELELRLEERPEPHGDAIARLNGYAVSVAGDGAKVGDTVKVRIERATPTVAYAVLADGDAPEPPVEAGVELERDDPGDTAEASRRPSRRGSRGGRSRTKAAGTAAEAAVENLEAADASAPSPATPPPGEPAVEVGTETPAETAALTETPPKKRTRRGSRGGRGRKKKTTVGAEPVAETGTDEVAASDGVPSGEALAAAPEKEAAPAAGTDTPSEPGTATSPEGSSEGGEKPKKRTRRGTRGGRNRRRKKELREDPGEPAEEPVTAVAAEEEPG
jgi:ribonuclease G